MCARTSTFCFNDCYACESVFGGSVLQGFALCMDFHVMKISMGDASKLCMALRDVSEDALQGVWKSCISFVVEPAR